MYHEAGFVIHSSFMGKGLKDSINKTPKDSPVIFIND